MNVLRISAALGALCLFMTGCGGTRPSNLGVKDGMLAPCPATPNCVSSQSSDAGHRIEPLTYSGSPTRAMSRLKQVVLGMKRTRIVAEQDDYVHAEFTSAVFRFVDDVEFALNEPMRRIEVRSASRLGRSDLGVNRKRVEEIRLRWQELPQ